MQVTMSTTNHRAHDAFSPSHSDLPIAIWSASFVIFVTRLFKHTHRYFSITSPSYCSRRSIDRLILPLSHLKSTGFSEVIEKMRDGLKSALMLNEMLDTGSGSKYVFPLKPVRLIKCSIIPSLDDELRFSGLFSENC